MFHNGVGETEDMGTRPLAHAGRRCAGAWRMGDMVGGGSLVILVSENTKFKELNHKGSQGHLMCNNSQIQYNPLGRFGF